MRAKTYQSLINTLKDIKASGLSVNKYYKEIANKSSVNFYQKLKEARNDNDPSIAKLREEFLALYDTITVKKSEETTTEILDSENHVEVGYERDEEDKILYYRYKIYKKDKSALDGRLTREEMSKIMRLYTYEGVGFTARTVSREFPQFSLQDLKRIFRAFAIFKDNCPFAPHDIEEKSTEELREIQLREKENDFMRKAEEDRVKNNEKLLRKYAQENIELKEQIKVLSNFEVKLENVEPVYFKKEYEAVNQSINLYISDIHLGATIVSGSYYKENVNYGFDEAKRRLTETLRSLATFEYFDTINIVLMGDNIDCCGFTGRTARLDHYMPENMDAREQGNQFINLMMWFIDSIVSNKDFTSNIRVYSVPNGNHGGQFEYMCNKALMATINAKYPEIKTTLWEEFYGTFEQSGNSFVILHGKDDQFMKKGFPLELNDKTKVMLYEWLNDKGIYGNNIHFIKGDLHSNSLSSCKRLDYRNVLSLFGASDYSNYNFSQNSYGVSYDLFVGNNIIRGTFENM